MSVLNDYIRSVSFNNVAEYVDELPDNAINFKDINFGYGASMVNDISAYYNVDGGNNYTLQPPVDRKRKTLTPSAGTTPRKLILKNKLSPQQLQYNIKNSKTLGINYHENLDDLIKNYETNVEAGPELEWSDSTFGSKLKSANGATPAKNRRKSYCDMTDEELMALDPQFQTTKSKIDQFKFDSQKTYYLPEKKLVVVPKQDAHKLIPDMNYKSINLSYKHEDFQLGRTLLSIIDGKKHTWSCLEWLLDSDFLADGDHVIISSLLPDSAAESSYLLFEKCQRIVKWFIGRVNPNLVLKVTVDLVINEVDDTATTKREREKLNYKVFINNLYHQYTPNILLDGGKSTNLNFKYPVKIKSANNKHLLKFSSYLVKYSSIPVVIVNCNSDPIRRMRKRSIESINSIHSSQSSIQSNERSDSIDVLNLINSDDPKRFENMLAAISDRSLDVSREYLEALNLKSNQEPVKLNENKVSFNNDVHFNEKMHSIYTSQLHKQHSGASEIYKVKSLLDNSSDSLSVSKSAKSDDLTGLTTKKIKSGLKKQAAVPQKKKSIWKKIFS